MERVENESIGRWRRLGRLGIQQNGRLCEIGEERENAIGGRIPLLIVNHHSVIARKPIA